MSDIPMLDITATPAKPRLPDVMPVRFTEGTFDRIDAISGDNKRAAFVRRAVQRALRVEERRAAKASVVA